MDPFTAMDANRTKTLWGTTEIEDFSHAMFGASTVTTEVPVPDPVFHGMQMEGSHVHEDGCIPLPFCHSVGNTDQDPLTGDHVGYPGEYYFSMGTMIDGDRTQEGLANLPDLYEYAHPVPSVSSCAYARGHPPQILPTASDSSSPELLSCGEFISASLSSPDIALKDATDLSGSMQMQTAPPPLQTMQPQTVATHAKAGGDTVAFPRLDFLMSPMESRSKPFKKSFAEREAKNRREQVRIREKNQALGDLKNIILSTRLLCAVAEQQRWTEKVTLDQAIHVIGELEASITKATGQSPQTPKPFISDTGKHKKKEPNVFLEFSEVMRTSFMEALRAAIFPPEFVQQKDLKVDNRNVTKLLSAVWNCLPPHDKHLKWRRISALEKTRFVNQARTIIRENIMLRL